MPSELPDDIWIEIIKHYLPAVSNVSMTNKRLRQIALPVLYHSLTFVGFDRFVDEVDHQYVMVRLIRLYKRTQSLYDAPHLLENVRGLTLCWWNDFNEVIQENPQSGRRGTDPLAGGEQMVSAIYDFVTSLVSHMPRLKVLAVYRSPMTSHLHNSIRKPHPAPLDTLKLQCRNIMWKAPVEPSTTLHLRHLTYNGMPDDTYLAHILPLCIFNLKTLKISEHHLSLATTCASNRLLVLDTLFITFSPLSSQANFQLAMWGFFPLCPSLKSLQVESKPMLRESPVPVDVLPNMESICAPISLVQLLASGRPLNTITIWGFVDIQVGEFSLVDMVRCDTTELVRLRFSRISIKSYGEILPLPHKQQSFPQLKYLHITVKRHGEDIPKNLSVEELRATTGNFVRQFPQLREMIIYDVSDIRHQVGLGCPIAPGGDPGNRGHPSLLKIQFMTEDTWIWVHKQGWVSRGIENSPFLFD